MAIPPLAYPWTQIMDPADQVEYVVDLRGVDGLATDGLLEPGELMDSWELVLGAESVALGLEVGTGDYAPTNPLDGDGNPLVTSLLFWFSVDPEMQDDAAYSGEGAQLPMELTIVTNSTPARTRQRTLVLKVAQR